MPINSVNNSNNYNSYRDTMQNWVDKEVSGENSGSNSDSVSGTGTGNNINALISDKKENSIGVQDFLQLMVSQLRNQDFMNPVDDTQYVTQLAQFATMQQMQELAEYSKSSYVSSLVGKNVTAAKMSVSGDVSKVEGPVEKITLYNNEYKVYVGGKAYSLDEIMILNEPTSEDKKYAQATYAASLVGKKVSSFSVDKDGKKTEIEGIVEKSAYEDGGYKVYINGVGYPVDDVSVLGSSTEKPDDGIIDGNSSNSGTNGTTDNNATEKSSDYLEEEAVDGIVPTQSQYDAWLRSGTQWW